jgi:hypothetical protein
MSPEDIRQDELLAEIILAVALRYGIPIDFFGDGFIIDRLGRLVMPL